MNELIKNTQAENLPAEFKATFSAMASKSALKDVKNYVITGITQAYAITGFKSNLNQEQYEKELMFLVESVSELIVKKVPNLRIEEIPIAFKNGVLGEYGSFQGLSVATFIFFAKSYYTSETRSKMILANRIENKKPIPSLEETKEMIKRTIINAYNVFLEKGYYEDYGNFIYDKMDKVGLISLSVPRKKKIYEDAKESLLKRKSTQHAGGMSEFKQLGKEIEMISDEENEAGKELIKTEAKKMALLVVFEDFKEMEIDINDIINQTEDKF